jgi:hypothetical protein
MEYREIDVMDVEATQELRTLEKVHLQAHLRTLLKFLPKFQSTRRKGKAVQGMIVVLDSIEEGAEKGTYLRSVPHAVWGPEEEILAKRREILTLMGKVIQELEADKVLEGGKLEVSPQQICEALIRLRQRMDEQDGKVLGTLLEETAHAIKGSVFDSRVIPQLEENIASGKKERWVFVKNYIRETSFEGEAVRPAFQALLSEVAATTCDLDIQQITPERVASISPLVLPFSALGVPRGAAVWFLLGEDEFKEIKGEVQSDKPVDSQPQRPQIDNIQGLVDVLSIFYSGAVIDIFTAYFIERLVRYPGKWNKEKFLEIAEQPFAYLYPSSRVTFLAREDERHENGDNDKVMEIRFNNPELVEFLGASGVRWELLYSKRLGSFLSWLDQKEEAKLFEETYHNQIEVALMALPSMVEQRLGVEYGQLMNMFGHHIGSLFKTSGVMNLREAYDRDCSPDHSEVRQVIDKLLPIWGVSRAVSLLKRQKTENEAWKIYKEWINADWVRNNGAGPELPGAILNLIRYVFDFASDQEPELDWIVLHPDGRRDRWEWQENNANRTTRLSPLPCFVDEAIVFDKTLAITIGLFEMVTNIRRYPKRDAAGREDLKLLEALSPKEREVYVEYSDKDGVFAVSLEQPCTEPHQESVSLKLITPIEGRLFDGLIQTEQFTKMGETSSERVNRYRQTWTFSWQKLKDRYNSHCR